MGKHTVEKIGGTSMLQTQTVIDNILVGDRSEEELYNRVFVVSAYAGVTNKLLEHKKTRKPGVFALFNSTESEWAWSDALSEVSRDMCKINKKIFDDKADLNNADHFVRERVEGVRSCLIDLQRLCSYGHFKLEEHMATVREMLSAIGEAHSAFNTALLLKKHGVNAQFLDLSGWRDVESCDLDERIRQAFETIDLTTTLPVVTGYANCREGMMKNYDRGYSEITFSRLAVITEAREAIIHKEYHLSSADPNIVNPDLVFPIGQTNYDVADQLSNLGMEAIHPRAAKGLRQNDIPLRVRNTFEKDHEGTTITGDYCSKKPCVEIIAGRRNVYAIELFDQDMVGVPGYDEDILEYVRKHNLKIVTKDSNANTLTYYVAGPISDIRNIAAKLNRKHKNATINIHKIAIVSAIGTDMDKPGLLNDAVSSLSQGGIEILAIHQTMRLSDIQFMINEKDYEKAIQMLHRCLVEDHVEKGQISLAA
jgi:aspartate kinase